MAKTNSKATRIFLDEYALSGQLTAVDMNISQEAPSVECFSDVGPRRVKGNYTHSHALRGFFDGESSQIDAIASTMIASTDVDHYLLECFEGATTGKFCYESIVQLTGEPIKASAGSAIVLEMAMEGAGGLARSRVLASGSVASTLSLLASVDDLVATTGGSYQAVFRCTSGVFTNCILQVQESSATVWTDIAGLTATFTLPGVARAATTVVTKQLKRVAAGTFAGTDAAVVVTAGLVAGSMEAITT